MAPKNGNNGYYFKDKAEAIQYYKAHEPELEDKPEWLIDCLIDFSQQFPNYKEYLEVECKVKNGQELTEKQKKKYGHLKWDQEYVSYKAGDVIEDAFTVLEKGEYDDFTDKKVLEKYNKYGLDFPEQQEPDDKVTIRRGIHEAKLDVKGVNKDGLKPEYVSIRELTEDERKNGRLQ